VYATGGSLGFPEVAAAGDITQAMVTIRTRSGRLCQINTSRRAAYGYDQRFEVLGSKGLLQADNVRPTQVVAWGEQSISTDKPEHFFLERYRDAYALEIAHFFDALSDGTPVRTTIADGIRSLELAELATRSFKEGKALECSI
jgi:myo-inositol 2-dehydrogenase/D-chiro-inositol 1-dehydrogenase